ncbi:MAG: TIGR00725 family protein [Bacillota bacterium]|nr:MAG: TIGR00725 family protein [Bacillota bacterium]
MAGGGTEGRGTIPPLRIAVIGDSGRIPERLAQQAYEVGREIARHGAILFSGGRDGVMAAVSRGAREAGGLTVGILPGDDPREGNVWVDVPVTTGLGMEWRSLVLIHAADAVIMIGGGNGTLGELSASYLNGRPVVVLAGTGGWADRIRQVAVDGRYIDHRRTIALEFATTPAEAAARAVELGRRFRQRYFPGPARWTGAGEAAGGAGDVTAPA